MSRPQVPRPGRPWGCRIRTRMPAHAAACGRGEGGGASHGRPATKGQGSHTAPRAQWGQKRRKGRQSRHRAMREVRAAPAQGAGAQSYVASRRGRLPVNCAASGDTCGVGEPEGRQVRTKAARALAQSKRQCAGCAADLQERTGLDTGSGRRASGRRRRKKSATPGGVPATPRPRHWQGAARDRPGSRQGLERQAEPAQRARGRHV